MQENEVNNELLERKSNSIQGYIYNNPENDFKKNINIKFILLFIVFAIHNETKKFYIFKVFNFLLFGHVK